MKYRIIKRQCLSIDEHLSEPIYEYAVQMKILFFWITIKIYNPEELSKAKDLPDKLMEDI